MDTTHFHNVFCNIESRTTRTFGKEAASIILANRDIDVRGVSAYDTDEVQQDGDLGKRAYNAFCDVVSDRKDRRKSEVIAYGQHCCVVRRTGGSYSNRGTNHYVPGEVALVVYADRGHHHSSDKGDHRLWSTEEVRMGRKLRAVIRAFFPDIDATVGELVEKRQRAAERTAKLKELRTVEMEQQFHELLEQYGKQGFERIVKDSGFHDGEVYHLGNSEMQGLNLEWKMAHPSGVALSVRLVAKQAESYETVHRIVHVSLPKMTGTDEERIAKALEVAPILTATNESGRGGPVLG